MAKAVTGPTFDRLYKNMYVCMRCNATNRSGTKATIMCRKCGSKALRLKNKERKG
ncbi:MAG: 50S ribosomal protein L40e [DPANN group archaeon]|nr:50S ribosomal protein L40e [DPANN group archaeon]